MRFVVLLAIAMASASCASPDALTSARAPAITDGKADSGDAADRACQLVLRSFHDLRGVVDAAPAASGAVGVLYHLVPDPEWYEVEVAADGSFEIAAAAPSEQAVVELVPFQRLPGGGRLFDHNRNPGDLDNYRLDAGNGFSLVDDGTCESPRATLSFDTAWQQAQHGVIVAGQKLDVAYDLHRMPQCFGSDYNGLSAWDTTAFVRFLPGGQLQQGSVKGWTDNFGQDWYSKVFTADVPADATSVELWFMTSGRQCTTTYDSAYGENYRFPVAAGRPGPVVWAGDWGNGFNRECTHVDGLADPAVLGSWEKERACLFVDADVYAPGVDAGLAARVVWSYDDGPPQRAWLSSVGPAGNNSRFRWELPRQDMIRASWQKIAFSFEVSTDGTRWLTLGPRTIVKDPSWGP